MDLKPTKLEAELAKEHIDELKREFRKKRATSVILAIVFLLLALALAYPIELPMMAFCSLLISVIFLLRYFDANGQLHIIGLRSTKTLYPRMSILRSSAEEKRTSEPAVRP